jgi:hypothetical protein
MTEYAQRQPRQQRPATEQDEQPGQDLRNGQLDADVACCLDEIDALLDTEQAERDQAKREFERFDYLTPELTLNRWQAKWAHLGLRYGRSCCGTPYVVDDKE